VRADAGAGGLLIDGSNAQLGLNSRFTIRSNPFRYTLAKVIPVFCQASFANRSVRCCPNPFREAKLAPLTLGSNTGSKTRVNA
jgi:hypothetical protein